MFLDDYRNLIDVVLEREKEDAEEICQLLDQRCQEFPEYLMSVYNQQKAVETAKAFLASERWDQERYKTAIEEADRNRRFQHDKSIQATKEINFFCEKYGIDNICPELEDRYDYGTWFCAVTMEVFLKGTDRTFDDIDKVVEALDAGKIKIDAHKRISEEIEI